jgi:serine/threonine protein kinase
VQTPTTYLSFFIPRLRGVVQGIIDDPAICQIAKVRNDDAMAIGIVMEYIPGGTLKDFLIAAGKNDEEQQYPKLNVPMSLHLCLQIAEGLHSLHAHSTIHGDLKPENILLTKPLTTDGHQLESFNPNEIVIRLADFGLSHVEETTFTLKNNNNVVSSTMKTSSTISSTTHNSNTNHTNNNNHQNNNRRNGFTLIYAAPELLEEKESSSFQPVYPTKASDLYALAIIMWEILCRKPPFQAKSKAELKSLILKGIRPDLTLLPKEIPRILQSLLKNLWNPDVKKRPEIQSCCDLLKKCVELHNNPQQSQPLDNGENGEDDENDSCYELPEDDDSIDELALLPSKQELLRKTFQVTIITCYSFLFF